MNRILLQLMQYPLFESTANNSPRLRQKKFYDKTKKSAPHVLHGERRIKQNSGFDKLSQR